MYTILYCTESQSHSPDQGQRINELLARARQQPVSLYIAGHLSILDIPETQASVRAVSAPRWLPPYRDRTPPKTFHEKLIRKGWLSVEGLGNLVNAWQTLYHLTQPDLIVIDDADTAQLAYCRLGVPIRVEGLDEKLTEIESSDATVEVSKRVEWVANRVLIKQNFSGFQTFAELYQNGNTQPVEPLWKRNAIDSKPLNHALSRRGTQSTTHIKTALLCSEQGKDLGKLNHISWVANQLLDQGYRVYVAMKDLSRAHLFLKRPEVHLLQAPNCHPTMPTTRETTYCFSDVLYGLGYADTLALRKRLGAWLNKISRIQPDLIVGDYAPVIQMAAHALSIPSMAIGTGFGQPCPEQFDLNYFGGSLPQRSIEKQSEILASVNQIYDEHGFTRAQRLSDVFRTSCTLICSLKEIEVYGPRKHAVYLGPIHPENKQAIVPDIDTSKPVVFAYLKAFAGIVPILNALAELPVNAYVYVPGLSTEQIKHFRVKGLHVTTEPIKTDSILPLTDIVICHAGIGLISQSLLAGVPLLLLPLQLEQKMSARKVVDLGAGMIASNDVKHQVLKMIESPRFKQAAAAIQKQTEYRSAAEQVSQLLSSISTIQVS